MKQFILFFLIAGIAALINIILRFIFSNVLNLNFNLAVTIAYLLGMLFNYYTNKKYNFRSSKRQITYEVYTFFVVSIIGLILVNIFSKIFLYLLTNGAINQKYIATYSHIIAVGLVGVYSFFAHKYFTFRSGIIKGIKKIYQFIKLKNMNVDK